MRVALLLLIFPSLAFARASSDVNYKVSEAFSAALRFVRVDRHCKVTDKDGDAAFINFECENDGKMERGALELFRSPKNGVRLQVTLGDQPHYIELRFLELLERKLRDELGAPPAPARAPPPDAGN